MKMVRIQELQPGELFAKSGGPAAEIGKVLAQNFGHTTYEDEYGFVQTIRANFLVWIDE